MLKRIAGVTLAVAAATIGLAGQTASSQELAQLKFLFPSATSFSAKEGKPGAFKAYLSDPKTKAQTVVGYAGYTTEWQPFERGYDGPIKILVGLEPAGLLSNIIVVSHKEPYGYRSVDQQRFADQFTGKSIQDAFKLRADVDAVSGATATVGSATRSIRDTAKRMAAAFLPPGVGKP